MTIHLGSRPATLAGTFSFYVPSHDAATLAVAGSVADAITVKGPMGPDMVTKLRRGGWDVPVIFDHADYSARSSVIEPGQWFDAQTEAGADRLLSPGAWLAWDPEGPNLGQAIEHEVTRCEGQRDVTAVFAVDHRWLTKRPMELAGALGALGRPAALVLAHPTDPLGPSSAVNGLIALTRSVDDLSILRTDHGGFGALAYGARHAAIGLIGSYRHFVPPGKAGGGKASDPTPRVFVPALMDWFTAQTISGWTTARVNLNCYLPCCGGRLLARFFDPRYESEAALHNRTALAQLADDILTPPAEERPQRFRQLCQDAIEHYGPMGKLSMVTRPKAQLSQWAFA